MDTSIIIFSAAILAVGAVPFVLMGWQRSRRHARLKKTWLAWADRCGLQPGHLHCSGHLALGLDAAEQWFLCVTNDDKSPAYYQVELAHVKRCRALQVNQPMKGPDGPYTLVDQVALQFEFAKAGSAPEQVLLFDSKGQRITLSDQLELARAWEEKLSGLIRA